MVRWILLTTMLRLRGRATPMSSLPKPSTINSKKLKCFYQAVALVYDECSSCEMVSLLHPHPQLPDTIASASTSSPLTNKTQNRNHVCPAHCQPSHRHERVSLTPMPQMAPWVHTVVCSMLTDPAAWSPGGNLIPPTCYCARSASPTRHTT